MPRRMAPEVGSSTPPISLTRVDLPEPLRPSTAIFSPFLSSKEMPSSTRRTPIGVWYSLTNRSTVIERVCFED